LLHPNRVDLSGKTLAGTDFSGSSLQFNNFTGADLQGADLRATDLEGARFSCADLTGAMLVKVLNGLDFTCLMLPSGQRTEANPSCP
jgi:uncharacterized protein YjbI with pentapeptide repeats